MAFPFDISILRLFFILFTSINISFTLGLGAQTSKNPKIITDELIRTICSKTNKPSLCLEYLQSLKGKTLQPNAVAAIGSGSLNMAVAQAKKTADIIWRRYTNTSRDEIDIRTRYHICFMIYSVDVNTQLKNAVRYMSNGVAESVKTSVSSALKRVSSCEKMLMKKPSQLTGLVLDAANLFKDICSVVLAICNKVPYLK